MCYNCSPLLNISFNAVMADGTSNPGANGQITPVLTNKKRTNFPSVC